MWNKGNLGKDFNGNIIIPNTVKLNEKTYRVSGLGKSAFSDCTPLKSVTMPGTVGGYFYVYESAFKNCTVLQEIRVSEELQSKLPDNSKNFISIYNES